MRALAAAVAALIVTGCGDGSPARGVELAPPEGQVLRLPIVKDIESFDPSVMSHPGVEVSLARNLFGGLYRHDNDLTVVPDLATGPPEVSADGRNWTFRLRPASFSNGDPVRAQDVVFSWNRSAARHNEDASVFAPVMGFADVQSGRSPSLAGLSAPDPRTVVARLDAPAGWWLQLLTLWPAWVLDERVVRARGEDTWWTTAEGLVGSGPFRLKSWQAGHLLEFAPVKNWWGGSTGALQQVRVEVVPDLAAQVKGFEDKRYDVVGYAPANSQPAVPPATAQRYLAGGALRSRLHLLPWLRTDYLVFNVRSGPLAGEEAAPARRALSLALDRDRYAKAVCDQGTTCVGATGGLIVKGLAGYLGERGDPNSRFDPAAARAAFKAWDPDGSRARLLKLSVIPDFRPRAAELVQQWRENLGAEIALDVLAPQALRPARRRGELSLVFGGFLADYDSPHDWYANLFLGSSMYRSQDFEAKLAGADRELPAAALPGYEAAGRQLTDEVAYSALSYLLRSMLVQPKVLGAGANALYEYSWTSIKIAGP